MLVCTLYICQRSKSQTYVRTTDVELLYSWKSDLKIAWIKQTEPSLSFNSVA
jgi:hypothetical protein